MFCPQKEKKKKKEWLKKKRKQKTLLHLKFSSSFKHKDNLLTLTTAPGYYDPQLRGEEAVESIEALSDRIRTSKACYWISSPIQSQ